MLFTGLWGYLIKKSCYNEKLINGIVFIILEFSNKGVAVVYLIQDANFLVNIFNKKIADEMTLIGVPTQFLRVGSKTCEKICRKLLPAKRLYNAICPYLNMQIPKYQIKKKIKSGDVFILYESANTISRFSDCGVHKLIRKLGGKVVSVIPDAWHISYNYLQKGLETRIVNSDLIAGVTPTLVDIFREKYPDMNVALMEESIDYDEWYCGHYHIEKDIDKIKFMHKSIIEFNKKMSKSK